MDQSRGVGGSSRTTVHERSVQSMNTRRSLLWRQLTKPIWQPEPPLSSERGDQNESVGWVRSVRKKAHSVGSRPWDGCGRAIECSNGRRSPLGRPPDRPSPLRVGRPPRRCAHRRRLPLPSFLALALTRSWEAFPALSDRSARPRVMEVWFTEPPLVPDRRSFLGFSRRKGALATSPMSPVVARSVSAP